MKKNLPFEEIEARLKFKEEREKHGIHCARCGQSNNHYWYQNLWRWQCKSCGKTLSLRSGTAMMYSKLNVNVWLHAAETLCAHNAKISALGLQKKLKLKRYESTWYMIQRIRQSMGKYVGNGANLADKVSDKVVSQNRIDRYTRLIALKRSFIQISSNPQTDAINLTMNSLNYEWYEELTFEEYFSKSSRTALKQIASRRALSRNSTNLGGLIITKISNWSNSVAHKLELVHKRVTKRYTDNYLDEFIYCSIKLPPINSLLMK